MSTIKELENIFEYECQPECTLEDILESVNEAIVRLEQEEIDFDNKYGRILNESYYDKELYTACLEAKQEFKDNKALRLLRKMKEDIQKKMQEIDDGVENTLNKVGTKTTTKRANKFLNKYADKALNADVTGQTIKLFRYKSERVTAGYVERLNKENDKFEKVLNKYKSIKHPTREDKNSFEEEFKKYSNICTNIIMEANTMINDKSEYNVTDKMVKESVKVVSDYGKILYGVRRKIEKAYNKMNMSAFKQIYLLQLLRLIKKAEHELLYFKYAAIQIEFSRYNADYYNAKKIIKLAAKCPSKNHLLKDLK